MELTPGSSLEVTAVYTLAGLQGSSGLPPRPKAQTFLLWKWLRPVPQTYIKPQPRGHTFLAIGPPPGRSVSGHSQAILAGSTLAGKTYRQRSPSCR